MMRIPSSLRTHSKHNLFRLDYARFFSLLAFHDFFSSSGYGSSSSLKVAVVSGGREPEISLLPSNSTIDILSYEEHPDLWDLNIEWSSDSYSIYFGQYDLVICEQVLEHVEDPKLAISNISKLLSSHGIVHFSVPAINGIHGLPNYCYSGFSTALIEQIALSVNLSVISSGSWGNSKAAMFYSICHWPPLGFMHAPTFLTNFPYLLANISRSTIRMMLRSLYFNIFVLPFSSVLKNDPHKPVILWFFMRKTSC